MSPKTSADSWIPEHLIDAINSGRCVLVVGRGLNKNAQTSYHHLLNELIHLCSKTNSISQLQKADLLASLKLGELDLVADTLSAATPATGLKALIEPVSASKEAQESFKAIKNLQLEEIFSCFHDTLLDESMSHLSSFGIFTSEDAKHLLDAKSQNRGFILKLFGTAGNDNVILSNYQFTDALGKNLILKQFLNGILASRILLFLGCDLEFVSQFMMSVGGTSNNAQSHYLLTNGDNRKLRSRLLLLEHRFSLQTLSSTQPNGLSDEAKVSRFLRTLDKRISSMRRTATGPREALPASPGIRRLLLEDIGPFDKLDISFSERHRWKIILGDNGVGKSTILKAIATAIVGADAKRYAGRLVRAGATMGRITLYTDLAPNGYVTEIYAKDMANEAEVLSRPARCLDAEGWLSLGFSPLRLINWNTAGGPREVASNARPTSDDLIPLLSGDVDTRANQIKQWIINIDASVRSHPSSLGTEHNATVRVIEFMPRRNRLLSAGDDGSVKIWSTSPRLRQIRTFEIGTPAIYHFALDAELQYLASCSSGATISVWSLRTYRQLSTLRINGSFTISCLAMLDRAIFVGTLEGQFLIVDDCIDKDFPQYKVGPRAEPIRALVAMPQKKLVAVGFADGCVRTFDYNTRIFWETPLVQLESPIATLKVDRAEQRLIVGLDLGSVFTVDLSSNLSERITESDIPISAIAISPDDHSVAIGDTAGRTRIWNLSNEQFDEIFDTHLSGVGCLAFHPTDNILMSGGNSGNLKAWTLAANNDRESRKLIITQFFSLVAGLTDRRDVEFLRVSDSFRVLVRIADAPKGLPIESLSQGMISLLSWFGVLYQRLSELNPSVPASQIMNQPALVLIDELDAHMHPLWQQGLVTNLKTIAPNVQFIACTHSPLIVAGLEKGEVERLQIVDGNLVALDFDADMTLGRADQILAGELFSLPTTLDVGTQRMLDRYVELLGTSSRTEIEETEFLSLTERIEERVPPSPSALLPRRARELLSVLYRIDLGKLEGSLAGKLQDSIALLSKALKAESSTVDKFHVEGLQ